ncbi:Protein FLX-like 2, partial [Mucuna pruriens]
MAARGKAPPSFEGRPVVQVPGMIRHGPHPGLGSAASHRSLESLPPQLLENRIAVQEAEIEQLVEDNRRLASAHVALREALVAAAQDVQKLKSHIRSIHTESDIQIRVLLDKIVKGEVDIRAGDSVKKDLQQAHVEAQNLAASRQELSAQIQRATQELKKVHSDVKSIPDLQAELDSLVQEHQRLRATFEYEKNKNIELVDYMKAKEKNLIVMAREVEMLRAEILNAEKRVNASNPFGSATPGDSSGPFVDAYGRAHGLMAAGQVGEGIVPVGDSNGVAAVNSAGVSGSLWSSPYNNPSVARRCLAAKGENSGECEKFAKYYRSLCPGEWLYLMTFTDSL